MCRKWPKIILFCLVVTGLYPCGTLEAQEIDVRCTVTSSENQIDAFGSITISIRKANQPCTAYLYDRAPWKGGTQLRKTENIQAAEYTFEKLPAGAYYLIVEDSDKYPHAEMIRID